MIRFLYIILGYFAGFLGIAFCFVFHLTMLAHINSFGVSFLSPYAPYSKEKSSKYFLPPLWEREKRRDYLNTKRPLKEDRISRKWKY